MSDVLPDDPEPEFDATQHFDPIDDGKTNAPTGRPDDYPGFESLEVLLTAGGRYKAGKSYRPDPSGVRRAVKVDDYASGTNFLCQVLWIEGLEQVFAILQDISKDPHKFVIRHLSDEVHEQRKHLTTKEIGYLVKRRASRIHGLEGYFTDELRQLQMLDFDGVALPDDMSIIVDPEGCINWAVDNLLPPEFADASFIYQLSASAGLTKLDNELNVHLWFFTNCEYSNVQMRTWAKWWNAIKQRKIVDPALFNEVQPHYTNEPELLDGLIDPLAGRRLGLIRRRRRTVKLNMPTDEEVATELKSKRERAIKQYNSAAKPGKPRKSNKRKSRSDRGAEEETLREDIGATDQEAEIVAESSADLIGVGDAMNLGHGWRGYLMGIGFEGHIRTQIRAAIGRLTSTDLVQIGAGSRRRSKKRLRRAPSSKTESLGHVRGRKHTIISLRGLAANRMSTR